MVELALFLIALIVLGIRVFRQGPNPDAARKPLAVWLARCALGLIVLYIAFFLFFGAGELFSGDLSGLGHLLPAILVAGIAILANKRPLEGGVTFIVLSILLSIYIALPSRSGVSFFSSAVLIVSLPLLLAGVLFLAAGLVISQQHSKIDSEIPPKVE